MAVHRPTPELPAHLRSLYGQFPFDRSLAEDPLSCVRPYAADRRAAEIAGLVAATIAIGNTTAIRRSFAEIERRLGGDFPGWVERADRADRALLGFRHRWIRGDQLQALGATLRAAYHSHGSVEELFLEGFRTGGFAEGLDRIASTLRAGPPGIRRLPRGYAALFPSPLARPASPCKRLTLYVRWMTRSGYPDLGLWSRVPTGELKIPLDQHVYWIAYHLGLTRRRSRNWATVEEVSEALRRIDPVDPSRFDFVLCHTGISGDCPKRRDWEICGACSVRPDCDLWRGRAGVAT